MTADRMAALLTGLWILQTVLSLGGAFLWSYYADQRMSRRLERALKASETNELFDTAWTIWVGAAIITAFLYFAVDLLWQAFR